MLFCQATELEGTEDRLVRAEGAGEWKVFPHQRTELVVVVDDDEHLNRALTLRLQASGLRVESALDGVTALSKIRSLEPDAIVLDLCLPRVNGSKLLHSLRTTPGIRPIPVVAVTGNASHALEQKVLRAGVRRLLRKPLRPSEIVKEVLEALEGY